MRIKKHPAGANGGAGNICADLGGSSTEYTAPISIIQREIVARRYRISVAHAATVARLHYGEARHG